MGRNNWTIFGSPGAARNSLVLSCWEGGVDPQASLEVVLGRVGTTPMKEFATFTLWGWKAARAEALAQS